MSLFKTYKLNGDGMIPCVVIDTTTKLVLMLAYMNEEAYTKTLETKRMTYYSRSRQCLWEKGLTSGNTQEMVSMHVDCDKDTLLFEVIQQGPACHTGQQSCFYTETPVQPLSGFAALEETISDRKSNPVQGSYTNYLFDQGLDKILKKIGEEASEIIIAAKNDSPSELLGEVADFMYHLQVLLIEKNLTFSDVTAVLENRQK